MMPKSSMIFAILFMTVRFCITQIRPEQWTVPIVSDEHGTLHIGDSFEQNETIQEQSPSSDKPQLMDELPLPANFYQEVDVEQSTFHVSKTQAIKTQLTDEDIESLPADLSQPLYTFMRRAEVYQNIAIPEAHQQEFPSTSSQEAVVMDMSMESTDMDLGSLLAYGDLGPLSIDGIDVEALSSDTDMEALLNDTYQIANALMRGSKHQLNTSDSPAHLQTSETFLNSTNSDGNMACKMFNGSACRQSFGKAHSNFSQAFVRSGNFNHSFINHTDQKPFQCDICLKQFSTSSIYQTHRLTHTGEKPFQCDICPKQFRTSSNCKRHRRTHTGEKPFRCNICSKQFSTSCIYKTHRRIHTGEKPFQCDICPKQFRTSSIYQTHRLTHTGEKPFQCDMCGEHFRTFATHRRHRRRHTGEKPYQCDICSKRFCALSEYRKHQQRFSGDEPYICNCCNQAYCSKRDLIKHIKKYSSGNASCTAVPVVHFL